MVLEQGGDGGRPCLRFLVCQGTAVQRGIVRVDPPQNPSCCTLLAIPYQDARRFRQLPGNDRQKEQRHDRGEEHRLPSERREHPDTEARGRNTSHRITAEHQGDQRAADARRGVFPRQGNRVRHQASTAEACDETQDAEGERGGGETIEEGRRAEKREADDDALLASDPVSERSEDHGAEHHAEQGPAGEGSGLRWRQAPVLHERWQDRAVDEHVVPIHYQQEPRESDYQPMGSSEASPIDYLVDGNRTGQLRISQTSILPRRCAEFFYPFRSLA